MTKNMDKLLIDELKRISVVAGNAILREYKQDIRFEIKDDSSPVTSADLISHKIINECLQKLTPDIPILSEENSNIPFETRSSWDQYWLIDPLDGTKEFINNNGEFTVNIALIVGNKPQLGVIHAPVLKETFWGQEKIGSYMENKNRIVSQIKATKKIRDTRRIVTSRSHKSIALKRYLRNIKKYKEIGVGSSLKFCLVAKGDADYYPRLGPTSEWDTAAGHAILEAAGGSVVKLNGETLKYNLKKDFLNPSFFAINHKNDYFSLLKEVNFKS
tara:strand:+ start:853 stop:1671 length:819 start_codon:yes stop_codon:yes gene_type:complete